MGIQPLLQFLPTRSDIGFVFRVGCLIIHSHPVIKTGGDTFVAPVLYPSIVDDDCNHATPLDRRWTVKLHPGADRMVFRRFDFSHGPLQPFSSSHAVHPTSSRIRIARTGSPGTSMCLRHLQAALHAQLRRFLGYIRAMSNGNATRAARCALVIREDRRRRPRDAHNVIGGLGLIVRDDRNRHTADDDLRVSLMRHDGAKAPEEAVLW